MYILLFLFLVMCFYTLIISSGKFATTLSWLWIGLVGYNSLFIMNHLARQEISTPRDIKIAEKAMNRKITEAITQGLVVLISLILVFFLFSNSKDIIIEHYKVFYLTIVIGLIILHGVHKSINFFKNI